MNSLITIYLTGLVVTFLFDLSIDIAVKQTVFNKKWAIGMVISFIFWPIIIVWNIVIASKLRKAGVYVLSTIGDDKNEM